MEQEQLSTRLLESLTPGGSEFVNNPQGCYGYVKQLIESQHKRILLVTEQRNALEVKLSKFTLM